MESSTRTTVVGVFHDSDRARDAIGALKDSGFDSADISVLMRDRDRAVEVAQDTGAETACGAVAGAVGGGLLGGLAGWLVGVGAIAIPGVGPFIAAGAIGTALAGAGIGAGVGAVAGALVGMGIPREEADWYEGEVREGRTLVAVAARDRYDEARRILKGHGAYDVHDREVSAGAPPVRETSYDSSISSIYGATEPAEEHYTNAPEGSFAAGKSWEDVAPRYRAMWEDHWGAASDERWDDHEVDYRFAWEMYRHDDYRTFPWLDVEPELRRVWEDRYPDMSWDDHVDWIQSAWSDMLDTDERFEIVGAEDFPRHEHNFQGDRCVICGATLRLAA